MEFAFVRLEKIAEDCKVPLEVVVSAGRELGVPTIPIDLGNGRAALLCETKYESQLREYVVPLEEKEFDFESLCREVRTLIHLQTKAGRQLAELDNRVTKLELCLAGYKGKPAE